MSKGNLSLGTKAWVDRINAAWHRSLESYFEAGRILLSAKAELPHGSFTKMILDELPFSDRTAQRLMSIASDQRLIQRGDTVSVLPVLPREPSILYAITQLKDDEFYRAIEAGTINPDMQLSDVPRPSRNLSVGGRPRGRPRNHPPPALAPPTIEGTATEVPAPASPAPLRPQPDPQPEPDAADVWMEKARAQSDVVQKLQRDVDRLEAENGKLRPPGPDLIPLWITHNKPDVNFWTALNLTVGEWSKLGSLDGHYPTDDTIKILKQFDLGRFVEDLDMLREEIETSADGVGNAA